MGVLMVGGLLVMASFAAVDPDITQSRDDVDTKQAYAAAESGLQWYMNALGRDNTYYLKCANPPAPNATEVAPVNQQWTSGAFKWRNVAGEQSKYGIELIPATGYSSCLTTDQYSMINPEGNMQLRITGRSRDETRTILATLRRQNFLDFIYFTHFETLDPAAYSRSRRRATATARSTATQRTSGCTEIQFADNDKVLGPFHTNDNAMICGNTQFGEKSSDRIEFNGPTPYVDAGGCNADPNIVGTQIFPAGELDDAALQPGAQEHRAARLPLHGQDQDHPERHEHDRDEREPAGRRADGRAAVERRHLRGQHRPARPATTARRTTPRAAAAATSTCTAPTAPT